MKLDKLCLSARNKVKSFKELMRNHHVLVRKSARPVIQRIGRQLHDRYCTLATQPILAHSHPSIKFDKSDINQTKRILISQPSHLSSSSPIVPNWPHCQTGNVCRTGRSAYFILKAHAWRLLPSFRDSRPTILSRDQNLEPAENAFITASCNPSQATI